MPSALWIARIDVTDAERYAEYARLAPAAIAEFGGKFLTRGGAYEVLEGQGRARNVVTRFPSMDAARDCYNSPAYQAALAYVDGSAERDIIIVEELE
ncbi:hypothetical protein BVG79_01037 [Ketogulonicigenium robustum]|uniref:DUF1330 domain-containing protein n=1 Tax=Ketogulonicigenium robustum TaxID=92947 RepID=A0A1W6NZ00_9RHOB|nr:DUF1330 domain-containing protein [Ketogulonicigenium robustum]ARO14383.1 hypothetical protein BVG79_01037 [Ketogulonicigenium robustum]